MRLAAPLHAPALALALALPLVLARPALAQPSPADRGTAESLFTAARELMKQSRFAEACPKLEESQRLDPGGGTLLNLGLCHEGLGRTASAWIELKEALRLAGAEGKPERARIAEEHLAALEARLSRLTISVAPSVADVAGLAVTLDGRPVNRPVWGVPVPTDPGAHEVVATAPGRARMLHRVELGANADAKTVTVAELAVAPPAQAAGVPITPVFAPAPGDDAPSSSGAPTLRILGFAAGGVGVASLVTGTVFGVTAISKRHDSDALCVKGRCTLQGVDLNEQAKHAALASDVFLGIGVAGVGAGVAMILLSSRAFSSHGSASIAPAISPTSAGATMRGRF